MKLANKLFAFSLLITASAMASVKVCNLQPDDYDGSKESIKQFEENIEKRMTTAYRKEHPQIIKMIQEIAVVKDQLVELDQEYLYPILPSVFHAGKPTSYKRIQRNRVKKSLRAILESDKIDTTVVESFNKENQLKEDLSMDVVVEYQKQFKALKKQLKALNAELARLLSFHITEFPTINAEVRGNNVLFGKLNFEAFIRPPKDKMLSVPLIKAGFKTDITTIIYACLNLDPEDSRKNQVHLYFLNTTKFYGAHLTDYLFNWNLGVRELLTWGSLPKANINAVAIEFDPIGGIMSPLNSASEYLAFLKPFEFLGGFIKKLGYTAATANPIQEFVLNNVGFGIKAIHLNQDTMRVDYAGSTMFDLWQFNLFTQEIDVDLSPFLNIMTKKSAQTAN